MNIAAIAAGVALVAGLTAGHAITKSHYVRKIQAAELERQAAIIRERDRADQITEGWAKAAEIIRGQQKTRTVYVDRETQKPEYRCPLPAAGGMRLQDAVREANGKSSPASRMPATGGADSQ